MDNDWQHLKPYGYAPGNYMIRCSSCRQIVQDVDKRAWRCRACAEVAYANGQSRRELEAEAAVDAEEGPLLVAARKIIAASTPEPGCHSGYRVPAAEWLALQGEVMEQLRALGQLALAQPPQR